MNEYWSWILSAIGLLGFFLAGRKIWYAWWINLTNQAIWATYSIVTEQWGFLVATFAYTYVFTINAIRWTKEHKQAKRMIQYAENDVKETLKLYPVDDDIDEADNPHYYH